MSKKLTEDSVLESFRQIHGNRYQYPPLPKTIKTASVIDIICPVHGNFKQRISLHKIGQGCPECGRERTKTERPQFALGREEWIRRFESVHGRGKYDYSKVPDNVVQRIKIEIYCPEHNVTFYQTPGTHWKLGKGCPKCGIAKRIESQQQKMITRREFELRAKAIHGDAFEYSELPQEFSLYDSIIIYCNEHEHIFFCGAEEHLLGKGCSS